MAKMTRGLLVYAVLCAAGLAAAWLLSRQEAAHDGPFPAGLEVYTGEGCIHCHSQYRRPVGIDRELWGRPSDLVSAMEQQQPVLFGNRRQGPDLSNVGARRSRAWNRAHLTSPREVRAGSRMPAYPHLFAGDGKRGEALLDYLQSLGQDEAADWWEFCAGWQPHGRLDNGDLQNGIRLFGEYCAGCHGASGRGDGTLASQFQPAPRDLADPAGWIWITAADADARRAELARLIKFGRPGTAMAGTEWLTERQLADLVRFLESLPQGGQP